MVLSCVFCKSYRIFVERNGSMKKQCVLHVFGKGLPLCLTLLLMGCWAVPVAHTQLRQRNINPQAPFTAIRLTRKIAVRIPFIVAYLLASGFWTNFSRPRALVLSFLNVLRVETGGTGHAVLRPNVCFTVE